VGTAHRRWGHQRAGRIVGRLTAQALDSTAMPSLEALAL
jgi:hypothetical protein